MFWNKKAKCPITEEDKNWIELRLNWINENVVKLKEQKTVLPTKAFFEKDFEGKEEDALYILNKLGKYFNINTNKLSLEFYTEEPIKLDDHTFTQSENGDGTAGYYFQNQDEYKIFIEIQQLKRPQSLIATLAHELSHYVLLGIKNFEFEGEENEWVTDLLTIAYGFGIFLGNTKFEFNQYQTGDGWGGWSARMQGYLPQQVIAYSLAEIEIKKGSSMPKWIDYLKDGFKKDFINSWKYIAENQNT